MSDSMRAIIKFAPGEVWELWLVYEDVFGISFIPAQQEFASSLGRAFGSGDMNEFPVRGLP